MTAKFFDLNNKRVIITGGSSGIGAEIVKKFCEQDSEVFFIDINETHAENLIKEIKNSNCLLYTSPSPRDGLLSRMPSSA